MKQKYTNNQVELVKSFVKLFVTTKKIGQSIHLNLCLSAMAITNQTGHLFSFYWRLLDERPQQNNKQDDKWKYQASAYLKQWEITSFDAHMR